MWHTELSLAIGQNFRCFDETWLRSLILDGGGDASQFALARRAEVIKLQDSSSILASLVAKICSKVARFLAGREPIAMALRRDVFRTEQGNCR